MHIRVKPGVTTTVLGLAGTGAAVAWPTQTWVGVLLILSAIVVFVAGIEIDGTHIRAGWPFRRLVPLRDACRVAFEGAERAGVQDLTTHPSTDPEERLRHFAHVFMADDEAILFGAKPPSTQLLPIPRYNDNLYPVVDENRFDYLTPRRVAYVNVKIRRSDLNRIIRAYPAEARKFARDHRIRR